MTKRALITVQVGQSTGSAFPPNPEEVEKYFEDCYYPSYSTGPENTVQERAKEIKQELKKLGTEYDDITIFSYSGGGFGLRYAISTLQVEDHELYQKIKKIVVRDANIEGGTVSPSCLIAAILYFNKGYPLENPQEDLKKNLRWLTYPQLRQQIPYWPEWDENWRNQTNLVKPISLRNVEYEKVIKELKDAGTYEKWGEGIIKVAMVNGGNRYHKPTNPSGSTSWGEKFFFHAQHPIWNIYMYMYLLSKRPYDSIQLESAETILFDCDFLDKYQFPGTKLSRVKISTELENAPDPQIAPGCFGGDNYKWGKIIKDKVDENGQLNVNLWYPLCCYIPTTSVVSIVNKPINWVVGKSKDQIEEASNFERIYMADDLENYSHGKSWDNDVVNELKTSELY